VLDVNTIRTTKLFRIPCWLPVVDAIHEITYTHY